MNFFILAYEPPGESDGFTGVFLLIAAVVLIWAVVRNMKKIVKKPKEGLKDTKDDFLDGMGLD